MAAATASVTEHPSTAAILILQQSLQVPVPAILVDADKQGRIDGCAMNGPSDGTQ